MKKNQLKKEEQRVQSVLAGIFGNSLKELDFGHIGKRNGIIITYSDFKTEGEMKPIVQKALGNGWLVVLKREYSDWSIAQAMLQLYKENKVSICSTVDGTIRCEPVRIYINQLLSEK